MEKILQIENVTYSYYDHIPALDNVSLSMNEGDRFAVIGANGSGKTSLLQIMAGLRHPSSGKVFFRGQEVSEQSLKDQSFLTAFREGVGYVFQDSDVQLFCPTVLDELLFGPLQLGIEENEAVDRAFQIMKMLNIERLKDRPSYMLSGGEKKRVAIASVLTMNPQILLLDEPTNGLDPRTQCFLTELILDLNEAGKTICISSHDLSFIDEFQPTVAVLSETHRVEKVGNAEEILRDEELLLRANLIHEHVHYHGKAAHTHRHSHYLYHKH
ncbi:MAG TPA: ABC transporter ATP-binding protein [Terriglobales bacterium]|nr:ABC transporter ATP-binding protein [Terriglobales bacterium]